MKTAIFSVIACIGLVCGCYVPGYHPKNVLPPPYSTINTNAFIVSPVDGGGSGSDYRPWWMPEQEPLIFDIQQGPIIGIPMPDLTTNAIQYNLFPETVSPITGDYNFAPVTNQFIPWWVDPTTLQSFSASSNFCSEHGNMVED